MNDELITTKSALKIAKAVEFPELVEVLEKALDSNVDFVSMAPNDDASDVLVQQPDGVMVAWMLPEDPWSVKLAVDGGVMDHHVTLCYLGDVELFDQAAQRQLIGVVAEVCQRHVGVLGTLGGTGTFDNDDATVWWCGVQIPGLQDIRTDLVASLTAAGIPLAGDYADADWQPHITLAYLPAGTVPPAIDVATMDATVMQLTVAVGGYRFDIPLQDIRWDEMPMGTQEEPRIVTPFIPSVNKALGDVDPDTGDEWRYTLGPVYMPGQVDAHGDSIEADDLEAAIHDYVRSGDRDIRLQHDTDVIAGEWVGLLVWPWAVTVPVYDEGQLVQRTFPAGTPFMGVVWTPEVWEDVKAGKILGYSLGGFAEFLTVDLEDGE